MTDPVERDTAEHAEEEDRKADLESEGEKYWSELRAGRSYGGIDIDQIDEAIGDHSEIGRMIRKAVINGDDSELLGHVKSVMNEFIDRDQGIDRAA